MDSELYHVGQLKRTCTELHDQIMKVEDLIKEEEDIITKHRIDICKLSECEVCRYPTIIITTKLTF